MNEAMTKKVNEFKRKARLKRLQKKLATGGGATVTAEEPESGVTLPTLPSQSSSSSSHRRLRQQLVWNPDGDRLPATA